MTKRWIFLLALFSMLSLSSLALAQKGGGAGFKYDDFSISKKDMGQSHLYTIDLRITDKIASEADFIVDFDYDHIRRVGIIMQAYYSNLLGKSQWLQFPFPNGIFIMPSNLLLPIADWLKHGMKSDGSWWVRIVMLVPNND